MSPIRIRRRNATDRILRMFAVFTATGYLFYLVLLMPSIIDQAERLPAWWTPLATVAVFGTGFVFGLAALLPDTRVLRCTGGIAAVTYLVAVATGVALWQGPAITDGQGIWLSTFPGVASLAAAAAWRPQFAFGHMIVACIGVQYFNSMARAASVASPLVPDIAFAIMFCTLFVGAAVMALRAGRILDSTVDATHAAAAAAAASHARTVERARFDALIHDGVMSTLLVASRQHVTDSLSEQAGRTLAQLDALRVGPRPGDRFDATELVTHLRTAADDVDEGIELDVRHTSGSDALTIPADSARAIGAALAEALRNSIRHAGPDATRSVSVILASDRLVVQVSDTGVGFDVNAVPAHRLGLSVSIAGRMEQIVGGTVRVESRPNEGTHIRLGWVAE